MDLFDHQSSKPATGSVTDRVLKRFVEAVGTEPGFAEISAALTKTLLEDRDDTEAALRKAIFGSDAP